MLNCANKTLKNACVNNIIHDYKQNITFLFSLKQKNRQSRLGELLGSDRLGGHVAKKGAARLGIFCDHVTERLSDQFDPLRTRLQLAVTPLLHDPVGIHVISTNLEFASEIFVGPATLLHGRGQSRSTESEHRAIFL